jgi:DNA-binding PadR family transcriptional regulator
MAHAISARAALLQVLRLDGPAHGLALIERVAAFSGGGMTLGQGTVYVLLAELEGRGLVRSWAAPAAGHQGGRPRRVYSLTREGAASADRDRQAVLSFFRCADHGAVPVFEEASFEAAAGGAALGQDESARPRAQRRAIAPRVSLARSAEAERVAGEGHGWPRRQRRLPEPSMAPVTRRIRAAAPVAMPRLPLDRSVAPRARRSFAEWLYGSYERQRSMRTDEPIPWFELFPGDPDVTVYRIAMLLAGEGPPGWRLEVTRPDHGDEHLALAVPRLDEHGEHLLVYGVRIHAPAGRS